NSTAGVSIINVHLRLNHSSNAALAEISARLNQVRSELPQQSESPIVQIQRTDKPYATFYISLTTTSLTLPQLNDYMVRELQPERSVVRLSDVARVELGSEEAAGQAGFNGEPAIWFGVWPLPTANELDVATVLKAKLAELQSSLPAGVNMILAYDGTYYEKNA